ncbi:hypothetical protein ACKVEX_15165 [Rhodocyclaceae bacterium SMB388]
MMATIGRQRWRIIQALGARHDIVDVQGRFAESQVEVHIVLSRGETVIVPFDVPPASVATGASAEGR